MEAKALVQKSFCRFSFGSRDVNVEAGIPSGSRHLDAVGIERVHVIVDEQDPGLRTQRISSAVHYESAASARFRPPLRGPLGRRFVGDLRIQVLIPVDDRRQAKVLFDSFTRRQSQPPSSLGTRLQQLLPCLCQGGRSLGGHDAARFAHDKPRIADVGCNAWNSACHRFGNGVRERFAGGRGRGDVQRVENLRNILALAEQMAHLLNSCRFDPGHELRIIGRDTFAAEHEPDFGNFSMQKTSRLA